MVQSTPDALHFLPPALPHPQEIRPLDFAATGIVQTGGVTPFDTPHLGAMKPVIGQPVPPFSLPTIDYRGTQSQISPASLAGKPFVLFVYPRDNTPGCSVEACNFRDLWQDFRELGVEILGLSRDSARSHRDFIKKNELPYLLLADERRELIGPWGLIINALMYGKDVTKTARTTFFVDASGIVREIWEEVSPPGHAAQVLEHVREWLATQGNAPAPSGV